MASGSYRQFCAMARALDVIGERWTLLVARELVLRGPRRFTDLRAGLPTIAPNVLSDRLKALQDAGVIRKSTLPPPAASAVYELTELGAGVEPVLVELARWGLNFMQEMGPDEIFDLDWLVAMVQALAPAEVDPALDETYEFRLDVGTLHARVVDGAVAMRAGPAEHPDLVIETDIETFIAIGNGSLDVLDAVGGGRATATGDPAIAARARSIVAPEPAATRRIVRIGS